MITNWNVNYRNSFVKCRSSKKKQRVTCIDDFPQLSQWFDGLNWATERAFILQKTTQVIPTENSWETQTNLESCKQKLEVLVIILPLRSQLSLGMLVTLRMPWVVLRWRPAHSSWLQGVVTGIGLQRSVYSPSAALAVVQPAEYEWWPEHDKPLDGSRSKAPITKWWCQSWCACTMYMQSCASSLCCRQVFVWRRSKLDC